jgi:hypothetical protein
LEGKSYIIRTDKSRYRFENENRAGNAQDKVPRIKHFLRGVFYRCIINNTRLISVERCDNSLPVRAGTKETKSDQTKIAKQESQSAELKPKVNINFDESNFRINITSASKDAEMFKHLKELISRCLNENGIKYSETITIKK